MTTCRRMPMRGSRQGAELKALQKSYGMLAAFEFLKVAHRSRTNFGLFLQMCNVVMLSMVGHIVPICQSTAIAFLYARWWLHGRRLDNCPRTLGHWQLGTRHALVCDMAGARAPLLLVLAPLILLMVASYLCLLVVFLRPAAKRLEVPGHWTIWDAEDGNIPRSASGESYSHPRLLALLLLDCVVIMWPLLVPYGIVVELLAYWTLCFHGNRIKYATASPAKAAGYGTLSAFGPPLC